MPNFADKWLATLYPGNCAELVRDVLREDFSKDFQLQQFNGDKFLDELATAQVRAIVAGYADAAKFVNDPVDGDIVLLQHRDQSWHVGVYVLAGVGHCLHLMTRNGKVSCTAIYRLAAYGYRVEGIYRVENVL